MRHEHAGRYSGHMGRTHRRGNAYRVLDIVRRVHLFPVSLGRLAMTTLTAADGQEG